MNKKQKVEVNVAKNNLALKIEYALALRANMIEHSANHKTAARVIECREAWKAIRKAEVNEKHDYSRFASVKCDIKNAIELQKKSTIDAMKAQLASMK